LAGKTEPHVSLADRPEGDPRHEPDLGPGQRLLGEGEAVGHAFVPEEGIERALWPRHLDAAAGLQRLNRCVAGGTASSDELADERLALADRDDAGMLQEGRRAAGVE